MHVPLLLAAGLLGSLVASLPAPPLLGPGGECDPQCTRDACLNAVVAHNQAPGFAAYHDCVSYQRTTVTPHPVTKTCTDVKTVTKTDTIKTDTVTHLHTETSTKTVLATRETDVFSTSYTTVATVTETTFVTGAPEPTFRKRTAPESQRPPYAAAVCAPGHYTSACECIHAPTQHVTAPTPTTTVTVTQVHTVHATATTDVVRQRTTLLVRTVTSTVLSTSTEPTVVATTVTTIATASPTGAVFVLYDMNDPSRVIYVPSGEGSESVLVSDGIDPEAATQWYLDADGSLHSVGNEGESAGIDPSTSIPLVYVHNDNGTETLVPLVCQLEGDFTYENATGSFNCTAAGQPNGFGSCDGQLAFTTQLGDGAALGNCADFTSFTIAYEVVLPDPIMKRRSEDGGFNRRRRTRRVSHAASQQAPGVTRRSATW